MNTDEYNQIAKSIVDLNKRIDYFALSLTNIYALLIGHLSASGNIDVQALKLSLHETTGNEGASDEIHSMVVAKIFDLLDALNIEKPCADVIQFPTE